LRASAAALLAPGAVLAALVVLALSGGFGALGSLGQAFAGPSLPAAGKARASSGSNGRRRHSSAVLVALAAPAPSGGAAIARPVASGPGTGIGTSPVLSPGHPGGGSAGHGPGSGGSGSSGSPGSTGSPGSPGSPPPSPSPPPTAPPPPHPPTLVDGVVALGASVTEKVPGPIGALATQTLKSVGQTLDGIIAPRAAGP